MKPTAAVASALASRGAYASFPAPVATLAELAVDRLNEHADQIDRAGSRGSGLLAHEQTATVGALERLADALDDSDPKLAARARTEARVVQRAVTSSDLRLWAIGWGRLVDE